MIQWILNNHDVDCLGFSLGFGSKALFSKSSTYAKMESSSHVGHVDQGVRLKLRTIAHLENFLKICLNLNVPEN